VRDAHQHYTLDLLYESSAIHARADGRRHVIEIDNARTNITPAQVEAILAGFESLREIVEVEV